MIDTANLDLDKIVKMIDQKIRSLENAKRILIDEFGGKGEALPLFAKEKSEQKETRKDQIVRFLQEEGPLSSKVIQEKTGLPKGTINYVLNDKKVFHNEGGNWHLVTHKKEKGLTG